LSGFAGLARVAKLKLEVESPREAKEKPKLEERRTP
jgi:hypothetical protein